MENDLDVYTRVNSLRKEVHTDSYPMSIGEVLNLYRDGDLILRPEYQRLFRWSLEERSVFIESLLLGLPVPTIFVQQDPESSKWALVDGVQRLSTLLQFVGLLRDQDNKLVAPLRLQGLTKMSFLNQMCYDQLDEATNRLFKREKLFISSIKSHSSPEAKYELFIRLNRSGQRLTNQEIRNAILTKENRKLYDFFQNLKQNSDFIEVANISESQVEDETDTELVVRFFALKNLALLVKHR